MKKITTLITVLLLVGCNSMQTNIEVDSVDTFNLDNYSDFSIKINESSISAEINPIDLERFKDNLKASLVETGLDYSDSSELTFEIIITSKDKVQTDRMNHYYTRYYWDNYYFRDDIRTITENILRVNLKDNKVDKTLWTVVTVWRNGSSKAPTSEDGSNIIVDEIMQSFFRI